MSTPQNKADNTKSFDKNLYELIPVQKSGKQLDLSERVDAGDAKSAARLFSRAKERLMTPSLWTELAAIPGTEFTGLQKKSLDVINGMAAIGDFIRIGIPGPEPSEGEGYDFVEIEKLDGFEDEDRVLCGVVMQVRPCPNPQLHTNTDGDEQNTAHFFESDATSSFIITLLLRRKIFGNIFS